MSPAEKCPRIRLGCQTITWGDERTEKREHTIAAAAEAGYEGVEIGARFLDLGHPQEFKEHLDRCGIELAAIHTGWNPFLGETNEGEQSEAERAITFAEQIGTGFLVVSGRDGVPAEQIADDLNALGARCRQRGVTLCYHNHWWEIENEAEVLRGLATHTTPEHVSFCPDIAWVRKTTPALIETLQIVAARTRLVHLKDYVADGLDIKDNETEFGQGIMDFEAVFAWIRALPVSELWVMAEQWKSSANHLAPEDSIRRNWTFLKPFTE